jgi:hypothetical protein
MLTNFKKWVQTTVDTTLSEFPINEFINDTNDVMSGVHKNGVQSKLQSSISISTSFQKTNVRPRQNGHAPLTAKHTMSTPISFECTNLKNNISDSFNSNFDFNFFWGDAQDKVFFLTKN